MLNYWTSHPERELDKRRFGEVLTAMWQRAGTMKNILAGFKASGIIPLCPSIIPPEAFALSDATKNDNAAELPDTNKGAKVSQLKPSGKPTLLSESSEMSPESLETLPESFETALDKSKSPEKSKSTEMKTPEKTSDNNSPTFPFLSTPKLRRRTTRVYRKSINEKVLHLTQAVFSDVESEDLSGSGSDSDFEVSKIS